MQVYNSSSRHIAGTTPMIWLDRGQCMLGGKPGALDRCQASAAFLAGSAVGSVLKQTMPGIQLISLDLCEPPWVVNIGKSIADVSLVLDDVELVARKFFRQFKHHLPDSLVGFYGGLCGLDRADEFTTVWRAKAMERLQIYRDILTLDEVISHVEPSEYFMIGEAEANLRVARWHTEELEDWISYIPWTSHKFQGAGVITSERVPMSKWRDYVLHRKDSSADGVILFEKTEQQADEWTQEDADMIQMLVES